MAMEKIGDLAKEYEIPTSRIRDAISRGEIPGEKAGNFWVVERDDFVIWAAKSKRKASPKPTKKVAKKGAFQCPACGSEDVKSAGAVISQGSFDGEASHSGIGVGSSGSISVGFGKSNLSYQSVAAKNVKVADEKNCAEEFGGSVGAFIGIILGFLLGFSAGSFWIGIITAFVCTVIGMLIGKNSGLGQAEDQRIEQDKQHFERSFVCQTCGHQFYRR